jgi:amino acid adenylation domain-containing protein
MLSDAQRSSLVARLSQGRQAGTNTIARRPAGMTEVPLSYGQEQLWFIDQLAPGLPTYNIAGVLRLEGPLDEHALFDAVDAVLARHEVLRTRLTEKDGQPYQVIDGVANGASLVRTDLTDLAQAERESEARRLMDDESGRPFDLRRGPLIRLRLMRTAPERHVLLVVVHHTVFDGWSFGVLTNELFTAYQAITAGELPELPELPVQFADYAIWEREHLSGSTRDKLVGYWEETLSGAPTLQLPTDRPRPMVQTYDGGLEEVAVDGAVLDRLRAISRDGDTTLFVTLMAAFQVLMHRFSGQDDIVVGTVSANRARPELAPLIGYLINTLAIRVSCAGDPTFLDLLARVRTATLGAYAHQELPFAKVVEALRVHRDPSRHPVFQVGFNVAESYEDTAFSANGLTVTQEELLSTSAKFDLLFSSVAMADGLKLVASYASALFDATTVRRLLGHFRVLLEGIVADPDRPLSALPLLSAEDHRREIVTWNSNVADLPPNCLHEQFEARVAQAPDAVAVSLDGADLTYAQLNAMANRIARQLHGLGVGPEVLVGVCMGRSAERVAALLGILKAGGGYVPLDPDYPADRLAFMREDAHLPVVVTDRSSAAAVPAGTANVLHVDGAATALSTVDDTDPGYPVTPSNAAYVIYTSGSTGRPKGVVVEHRQAVNFANAEVNHWPVDHNDRVLQFASLNFDVSVLDIFCAILSGATLVLGSNETLLSPPRLAELIRRERITVMCLPPAVLNLLADERFPDLRVVIAGGEAFSSALVRRWVRPGLRFVNGYGPTETTVGATMLECTGEEADPLPIGLPLTNYTAYVLDELGGPVPLGVTGELHIGGAGVARGYLNRPELTRERFVPDPFSEVPGARMYKTGDLARRLPDGNLQFLGRLDDQVKIRGLRVELGEIEAVLTQHPAVRQAVALSTEDRSGDKQLVAYARTAEDVPAPATTDLRQHLAQKLPSFMIPAHVVVLDSFPLNANGKVDRSKLPAPNAMDNAAAYLPPRTLIEALLVDTYGRLLNLDQVGVDDSFFDLGGNSLQAMQLITRLRDELLVDTDLTAIFLAPSPAGLAVVLREVYDIVDSSLDSGVEAAAEERATSAADGSEGAGTPTSRTVRLSQGTGSLPLYLIHAIGGTVYSYAPLARELADTYEVSGIEAAGLRAGAQAVTSLADMVANYVELIRDAQPNGPYRLGGWSLGGLVALRVAGRLIDLGEEIAFVALLDTPTWVHDEVPHDDAEFAARYVADAARSLGADAGEPLDPGSSTAVEQLDWLVDRLVTGERDQVTARAEIERRFEVYKAHYRLISGYTPRPLDVEVLVVTPDGAPDDVTYWSRALGRDVRGTQVPGDHYSFLDAPGVGEIGAALVSLAEIDVPS